MNTKEKQELNCLVRLTSWWIKEWHESLAIPNQSTLDFLSHATGSPISDILLFFKDRKAEKTIKLVTKQVCHTDVVGKPIFLQKNDLNTGHLSINDPAVREFVDLWGKSNKSLLSMGDKCEIGTLIKRYPSVNILDALTRWNTYQEFFKDVTLVERMGAYLFGNKFPNFVSNIEKFIDENTFQCYFNQHKQRLEKTKNKVSSFGFSPNPIEDRQLAEEFEKENIAFAFASGKDYDESSIQFDLNKEYYKKMMKKITRSKK